MTIRLAYANNILERIVVMHEAFSQHNTQPPYTFGPQPVQEFGPPVPSQLPEKLPLRQRVVGFLNRVLRRSKAVQQPPQTEMWQGFSVDQLNYAGPASHAAYHDYSPGFGHQQPHYTGHNAQPATHYGHATESEGRRSSENVPEASGAESIFAQQPGMRSEQGESKTSRVTQLFNSLLSPDAISAENRKLAGFLAAHSPQALLRRSKDFENQASQAQQQNNHDRGVELSKESRRAYDDYLVAVQKRSLLEVAENPHVPENSVLALSSSDERSKQVETAVLQEAPRLHQRRFFDPRDYAPNQAQQIVIMAQSKDPPIELPLSNFVFAEGFSSWKGRGQGGAAGKMNDEGIRTTSQNVVEDYAGRETEAPPIEYVEGYVQPNGLILYVTRGGSHRTAAAIQKADRLNQSDATIKTNRLHLKSIDRNIVSLESDN